MILSLCGLSKVNGSWTEELQCVVQNLKGKKLISSLLHVAWKAFIYHVWREKNQRLYKHSTETTMQILEHIKEVIQIRLAGLKRVATMPFNRQLCKSFLFFFVISSDH